MKKFCCFLLTIIFCSISLLTVAEESEKKILFRNNEWGASFEEVRASFPSSIRWWTPDADSSYSIMDHMLGTHSFHFDGHVCCYVSPISSSLKDFKVAGYDVSYIQLRFAFIPTDEGIIVEDYKHTALYFAKYRIDCRNALSARDDLIEKLSVLYGNEYIKSSPPFSFTDTYYTWYGAEGTMLTLMIDIGYSKPRVELMYGFKGGDALLLNAYKALEYQESIISKSNYDGL